MTCHHEACSCPISGPTEFCGSHCHNAVARDLEEMDCGCGHGECDQADARAAAPLVPQDATT